MTTEDKAKEFAKLENPKLAEFPNLAAVYDYGLDCAMKMAEWKEQETKEKIIKKAWDWFDEHFDVNIYEEIGGRKAAEILTYDFKSFANMFEDFKKAIKGE